MWMRASVSKRNEPNFFRRRFVLTVKSGVLQLLHVFEFAWKQTRLRPNSKRKCVILIDNNTSEQDNSSGTFLH